MDEAREPEDRIEHIVRQAEQGAQFEFNPAAWDAMEQKLDALDPVPFSIWKIIFPLTGVAVLLMVLLWPIGAQDIASRQARVSQATAKAVNTEEAAKEVEMTSGVGAEAQPQTAPVDESQAATAQEIDDNDQTANDESIQSSASVDNTITSAATAATESPADPLATRSQQSTRLVATPAVFVTREDEEKGAQEASGLITERSMDMSGVDMLAIRYSPRLIELPAFEPIFVVDSANFKEGQPKPYFEKSRWAVSAMVSLDMSATGLDGFTDPGTMFGLGVEYYIAPSWSIQSGAAIAVKKYSALGSEYEIDWGAARLENLETVLANCLVIDIPINIRKYFYTKKGNTWFASTGISSYLMLREDYNYTYTENIPNWAEDWQVRNQNQHYLGIMNLSFGYETPISNNLGLAVEPFVKLPLTGIGQGSVKFLSFGTVIAIKLRK